MRTSLFHFIFSMMKPYKWHIVGQIGVALFFATNLTLRPYLLKEIIDSLRVIQPESIFTVLWKPISLYMLTSILIVLVYRIYDYIWMKFNSSLRKKVAQTLTSYMMQHSYHFYQNQFVGSLGSKIKEVMNGTPDIIKILIDSFLSKTLATFFSIYLLFSVQPRFACFMVVWIIIFTLGSYKFTFKARKYSQEASEANSLTLGTIVDMLGNMMAVRLFTGKKKESLKINNRLDQLVQKLLQRDHYFLKINAFQGVSFIIYQFFCIYYLVLGFKNNSLSAGDFVLVLTLNNSMIDSLWSLSMDIGNFSEKLGNIREGLSIFFAPLDIKDKENASELKITQGEIIFERVTFHYNENQLLFKNLSLTIPGGQKVGLVGYSGSGKTSFVHLILRLFEVESGKIMIDGQDISQVTQKSLHKSIGMIPQDPSLFHRSLEENIGYGKEGATLEEIIKASQKACAHEFISRLPEGYNSQVGERGIKLSGGQRQRIAIARAILKNAPILIMDEATSQLDSLTETEIQESFWTLMQGKTTLIIAHRLSTLLHMDRIIVFHEGEIVEEGSHHELLAKIDGRYKMLWDAQIGGFLPDHVKK